MSSIFRAARNHSDRFEREIPLFKVHSTTPVRAIFEHSRNGPPRMADSVLDLIRKPHFFFFLSLPIPPFQLFRPPLSFIEKNILFPFHIGSNYIRLIKNSPPCENL